MQFRSAAANRSLLVHQDLIFILYRWWDLLNNDPTEVRAWVDGLLSDPEALVILAREFTGQSWSMGLGGFGGLGDRVSMPTTVAKIGDDTDIIDVTAFRDGLEKIRDAGTMDEDSLRIVREFLDAWDRKHRGEDD